MKKYLSAAILFCWSTTFLYGQYERFRDDTSLREFTRIHVDKDRYIPGESMLLSVHCQHLNGPSNLSKVATIVLLNQRKESVMERKIELRNGHGSVDLYVPSYIPTGSYVLIAYTSWMLNFNTAAIAQVPIQVINPFQPLPSHLFEQEDLQLTLSLYPEGGSFLKGRRTNVLYEIRDQFGREASATFQLTTKNGEPIASVDKSANSGAVTVVTTEDEVKAILIDQESNLHFNDVLIAFSDRPEVNFVARDTDFKFTYEESEVSLKVLYRGITVSDEVFQGTRTISKRELPAGALTFVVRDKDRASPYLINAYNAPNKESGESAIDKKTYKRRDTVTLQLSGQLQKKKGIWSVTVHPKPAGTYNASLADYYYGKGETVTFPQPARSAGTVFDLPDFRGSLVKGNVQDGKGNALINKPLWVSNQTENPTLKLIRTDEQGEFSFYQLPAYTSQQYLFHQEEVPDLSVKVFDASLNYDFVEVPLFYVDEGLKEWLQARSLEVQVMNTYYEPTDERKQPTRYVFDYLPSKTYRLDDYKRFPKMLDPLREYVPEIWVKKKEGRTIFDFPYVVNQSTNSDSSLILLNGIPVTPDFILEQNPQKFEVITLYERHLMIGGISFNGAVNFVTFEKQRINIAYGDHYQQVSVEAPYPYQADLQSTPNHSERIPDYRSILHWEPNIRQPEATYRVTCSDRPGSYELILCGIFPDGSYVEERLTFEVGE